MYVLWPCSVTKTKTLSPCTYSVSFFSGETRQAVETPVTLQIPKWLVYQSLQQSNRHWLVYWATWCVLYLGPCLSGHSSSTISSVTTLEDTQISWKHLKILNCLERLLRINTGTMWSFIWLVQSEINMALWIYIARREDYWVQLTYLKWGHVWN